ncbi:ABC transporter permease [Aeromicrobium sp. CTD01-1L150]|uniref:ABC transporter permease n=1 Tax=Aeromicrobium sp. CTD01-1L150 TaxID=3341830 RepID=UPI0035C0C91E
MRDSLVGAGTFVRFFVRRDRWMVLAWTVGISLMYWIQAVSVEGLYSTQEEFDVAAASMESNAGFVAMLGPTRVLNTVGGQVSWQSAAFGAILAGLMSMFLVSRHTRAEEESGREELVRSGVVGRRATVTATVVVLVLANVVVAVGITLPLLAHGLDAPGSIVLGVAAGLAGVVFGAVALVAAQLSEGTRSVYGVTGGAIGAAYVLRGAGDVAENGVSWLSPIGWGQAMRAYDDELWWPAALSLVVAALLIVLALVLLDRRDVGAGLWPARRGPATSDIGAFALAWKLQRGMLIGWTVGLLFMGAAYGSIGDSVGDLLGDSDLSEAILADGADSLTDAFFATAVLMVAVIASAYAIGSALRPRGEEVGGRVEPLLATALPRLRWAAGHAVITVAGVVVVLLAAGLGMGATLAVVLDDGSQVVRMTGAVLAYAPAVLVLSGLTRLAYGIAPRAATLGWLGLAFCAVVVFFGDALQMPDWLKDVSPFTHLAMVPVESFAVGPALAVGGVALGLSVAGHLMLARRDLMTT